MDCSPGATTHYGFGSRQVNMAGPSREVEAAQIRGLWQCSAESALGVVARACLRLLDSLGMG